MLHGGTLIIDDAHAALGRMTGLGRDVAAPAVEEIRATVLRFAERRHWIVLPYQSYAEWARLKLASNGRHWVVLDPLFERDGLEERASFIRVTRHADPTRPVLIRQTPLEGTSNAREVGVLDDAVSSGRTLRTLMRALAGVGRAVSHVIVCASSRHGEGGRAERGARRSVVGVLAWRLANPPSERRMPTSAVLRPPS